MQPQSCFGAVLPFPGLHNNPKSLYLGNRNFTGDSLLGTTKVWPIWSQEGQVTSFLWAKQRTKDILHPYPRPPLLAFFPASIFNPIRNPTLTLASCVVTGHRPPPSRNTPHKPHAHCKHGSGWPPFLPTGPPAFLPSPSMGCLPQTTA